MRRVDVVQTSWSRGISALLVGWRAHRTFTRLLPSRHHSSPSCTHTPPVLWALRNNELHRQPPDVFRGSAPKNTLASRTDVTSLFDASTLHSLIYVSVQFYVKSLGATCPFGCLSLPSGSEMGRCSLVTFCWRWAKCAWFAGKITRSSGSSWLTGGSVLPVYTPKTPPGHESQVCQHAIHE